MLERRKKFNRSKSRNQSIGLVFWQQTRFHSLENSQIFFSLYYEKGRKKLWWVEFIFFNTKLLNDDMSKCWPLICPHKRLQKEFWWTRCEKWKKIEKTSVAEKLNCNCFFETEKTNGWTMRQEWHSWKGKIFTIEKSQNWHQYLQESFMEKTHSFFFYFAELCQKKFFQAYLSLLIYNAKFFNNIYVDL